MKVEFEVMCENCEHRLRRLDACGHPKNPTVIATSIFCPLLERGGEETVLNAEKENS